MQKYVIEPTLNEIMSGIIEASELMIKNSRMIEHPIDYDLVAKVIGSRNQNLDDIGYESTLIVGNSGAGKTTMSFAALHKFAQRYKDDVAWDTYYINLGGEIGLGFWRVPLGLTRILTLWPEDLKKDVLKGINEDWLIDALGYGKAYETFHMDDGSGIAFSGYSHGFFNPMINNPSKGIYIFDDVQNINILPEKLQLYFLNKVVKPLSEADGCTVFLNATHIPEHPKFPDIIKPPQILADNFPTYALKQYEAKSGT